jgi:CMD domain protein
MSEAGNDILDQLAGLSPDSPLAALRRQRPDVVAHTQGSDDAIFRPKDDAGFTPAERAAAALRVALGLRDEILIAHYRERLHALDPDDTLAESVVDDAEPQDKRWAAIIAHVDRLTRDPESAQPSDLQELTAAGLSAHAIVSLSQLIAYVNFQSRVLAGLRMLREAK